MIMDNSAVNKTNSPRSVKGMSNLLEALLAKGLIDNKQFNEIKFEAINSGKPYQQIIKEKSIVPESDVFKVLAEMNNLGFISLSKISIPDETLNKLPKDIAKEQMAIVFEDQATKFKVAMKDPLDLQKVKFIESTLGKQVETFFASEEDINNVIETRYGAQIGTEVDEALEEVGEVRLTGNKNYGQTDFAAKEDELGAAPIIRIVNMILEYAINNRASDIHVEPRDTKVSVRFRVRGVLAEKLSIPKKLLSAVVTRIKILSNMKIDEHRITQDGRFQVKDNDTSVDVRVSIMPTIYGEKIVMRILEKTKGIMKVEDSGLRGLAMQRARDALNRTQGIILVTGPTGSGKSTTLASFLSNLNKPEVNIITLEDPVEIRIEGVNQVQVNSEVGLTFASGLRSILRQDPDIIMVGEIRDSETAALAVQSALVGRLVLTTIHTNSAAGAFVRLIDMGIEPFLLSSTVNIVIAQRLVRTLTPSRKPYKASSEIVAKLHEELDSLNGVRIQRPDGTNIVFDKNTQDVTLYEPVATPTAPSGYDGRIGIFEALKMTETISRLVAIKSSIQEIHRQAVSEGMVTMVQDGFIKALEGVTTIEEVLRVRNE